MSKKEIRRGPFLFPMPVVLVGANKGGKANFMTAAFAGIVNMNPPAIALGLGKSHFTSAGIDEGGVFSVNLPSTSMMKVTDYCGLVSGHKIDKSEVFKVFYGKLEKAPMIEECPLTMECKLLHKLDLGVDSAFIGEIIAVYCDDKYMAGEMPDMAKIDPLLFSMGDMSYWNTGKKIGAGWSVGKGYK
ncbi:MAG: flavin reductase family protein [Dehalococcoidia bacterium]